MSETELPDELPDGNWFTTTEDATGRIGPGRTRHLFDWSENLDDSMGAGDTLSALCGNKRAPEGIAPKPESIMVADVYDLLLANHREQSICKSCWRDAGLDTYLNGLDIEALREGIRDHLDENGELTVETADDLSAPGPDTDSDADGHTTVPIRLAAALEIDVPDTLQSDLARVLEMLGGNVNLVQTQTQEPQEVDATVVEEDDE